MKAAFYSLGCKVNSYEIECLINMFKDKGYEIVPFKDKADIYVINTCSVTNTSDQKSRKIIREACKNNKDSIIIVMGCYSQLKYNDIKDIDNVKIILGTNYRTLIFDLIKEYKKSNCLAIIILLL